MQPNRFLEQNTKPDMQVNRFLEQNTATGFADITPVAPTK